MSPLAAVRARLQSIMPAPVSCLNCFTSAAETAPDDALASGSDTDTAETLASDAPAAVQGGLCSPRHAAKMCTIEWVHATLLGYLDRGVMLSSTIRSDHDGTAELKFLNAGLSILIGANVDKRPAHTYVVQMALYERMHKQVWKQRLFSSCNPVNIETSSRLLGQTLMYRPTSNMNRHEGLTRCTPDDEGVLPAEGAWGGLAGMGWVPGKVSADSAPARSAALLLALVACTTISHTRDDIALQY